MELDINEFKTWSNFIKEFREQTESQKVQKCPDNLINLDNLFVNNNNELVKSLDWCIRVIGSALDNDVKLNYFTYEKYNEVIKISEDNNG